MDVSVQNQSGVTVDLTVLKGLAEYVLGREAIGGEGDISVALVDVETMTGLNRRWRSLDKATDVLAFDLGENGELAGEVIISPQVAAEQAREEGVTQMEEMQTLLIHGLLHLLGYNHDSEADAKRMFDRQGDLRRDFVSGGR